MYGGRIVLSLLALAAFVAPAHADPSGLATASAYTALAQAGAVADATFVNTAHPDVTCANPTVAAGPVTPAGQVVVGEVYGNDAAEATAECASLQGHAYVGTLTIRIEYQPTPNVDYWVPIPGCYPAIVQAPSVDGALTMTSPLMTCGYDIRDAAYGKVHRAHAWLSTTEVPGALYHGYSGTWQGGL
jgi:hypothetical protein